MRRQGFGNYRGRRSLGRQILVIIAVILAIALVFAVLAAVILPNYIEYTPDGPRVVLPFFSWTEPSGENPYADVPTPAPSDNVIVVVEAPTPTPSPTPTPAPPMPPRRNVTRGLVPITLDTLIDGSAISTMDEEQGAIVDVSSADLTDQGAIRDGCLALPYVAAYLKPGWAKGSAEETRASFEKNLTERCATLAALGFDEIVLSRPSFKKADAAIVAEQYAMARAKLNEVGFQGRLSLVCGREVFVSGDVRDAQIAAISQNFDRIYAAAGENWGGIQIYQALNADGMEFRGTTSDIVTVVRKTQKKMEYPWAVLPQ